MNKLDQKLREIEQRKKVGLMTHVVIGHPSLAKTVSIVKTMVQNGADLVELQIPFSDPLADGPTIMNACENSLKNGTKVKDAFEVMKKLSQIVNIPLLFMGYYNTVFNYGVEKFCFDAASAGASGLIFPDFSLDEESKEHFLEYCGKYNLHNIQVISPVSTDERLRENAKITSGFVYCASLIGTTGIKNELDPGLAAFLKKARKFFNIPLAVGFGISKSEHIHALKNHTDIVVTGSAIIEIINKSDPGNTEKNVSEFLKTLSI